MLSPAVSAAHKIRKNKYCTIKGLPTNRNLIGSWSCGVNNFARKDVLKCIDKAEWSNGGGGRA